MPRLAIVLVVFVAGCCFTPTAGAPAFAGQAPESCVGHWTGVGTQPGFPPWTIDMNVTSRGPAQCGTIEYPTLGCGGTLDGCGALADGEGSFTELYTHTNANCSPAGTIRASCTGTTMTWTWEGQGGPVTTTLTRM